VAQQRAGRVAATGQLGDGTVINDDPGLEHEADRMGARATALASSIATPRALPAPTSSSSSSSIVQGLWTRDVARTKVAIGWKHRGDAYNRILGEFQYWQTFVSSQSGVVKQQFLNQLIRMIDEYIDEKQDKQRQAAASDRQTTINGMVQLRGNVETELRGLGNVTPGRERVYVGGGQKAIDEDSLMSSGLANEYGGVFGGKQAVLPGTADALADLGNGATIHAFGHGNFGTGIGSTKHKMTPAQLVDGLISDGLPLDKPVVLRLFACGTGAESQRGGQYLRNETAFVQRVAQLMARRGFQHAMVIGYALYGIPAAYQDAPLGKGRAIYSPRRDIHHEESNKIPVTEREVVWAVRQGRAWKSSGTRWVASNPSTDHYEINRA
jgi:hypothetical protein